MFAFEGTCGPEATFVPGPEAETLQLAANGFAERWAASCDDELPQPITWFADGQSNSALTNVSSGFVTDWSSNPLPEGSGSVEWSVAPAGGSCLADAITSDQTGTVFAWGFMAVVGFWVLGHAIGVVRNMIRKA